MDRKMEDYREAQSYGQDAAFVANLILTRHRNPARKLNGLVALLRAKNEIRTAQFSADELLVNGNKVGWETLESHKILKTWGIAGI